MGDKNFWERVGIIDKNKSGNPGQKKQRGEIKKYVEENGDKSYIDSVINESQERSEKLDEQIKANEGRGVTVSLEHSDPERYRREKEETETEEMLEEKKIKELKNKINNMLS